MTTAEVAGICSNPKCAKPVFADHEYTWCIECGEPLDAELMAKLPRVVAPATAPVRSRTPAEEHEERRAAVDPVLQPGERLLYWSYAIEMRRLKMLLLLFAPLIPIVLILAFLFGEGSCLSIVLFWVSWITLGTWLANKARKDYLIALTDRRLIVLTIKTPIWFHVDFSRALAVRHFDRSSMPPISTDVKPRRVKIKIDHPTQGFDASFPGGRFGDNYTHAVNIVAALKSEHA